MAFRIAVNVDVFARRPLFIQLAHEIRLRIEDGTLGAQQKLPSIREMSKQLQLSEQTVRRAYSELEDGGFLESRHGSGVFVSAQKAARKESTSKEAVHFAVGRFEPRRIQNSTGGSWEARSIAAAFNAFPFHPWWDINVPYDFRAYQPASIDDAKQNSRWKRALSNAAKRADSPGDTDRALREHIAGWLHTQRGLPCHPDEITLVAGAQQARDLIARLLVTPGTLVAVQEPGSITDSLAYAAKGAQLVAIEESSGELDLGANVYASIFHVLPDSAFPTGARMSDSARLRLLTFAAKKQILLVEDSYGAAFNYESDQPRALYAQAKTLESPPAVVHIGSLSHLLGPGFRIGYIVAPVQWAEIMRTAATLIGGVPSTPVMQLVNRLFAADACWERLLALQAEFKTRRDAVIEGLRSFPNDMIRFDPVQCGFQQSVWFSQPIDDLLLFERALPQGIGIIPLSPYFRATEPKPGIALSFARLGEGAIVEGISQLTDIICKMAQTGF